LVLISKLFLAYFLQSLFGLSTPVDIEVTFTNEEQRKHMEVKVEKDKKENYPVFLDGESVSGKVNITFK
jgi:vacuolar protein sorting-associated protein 26